MLIDFAGNLEDKFGQIEIITGPMASGKSSLALVITTIFRHFANELNCKIDLFRPDIDTRPEMSRLGIEKDKEFKRINNAKEITRYIEDKTKFGKRRVILIDEVEFLDSEIINAVQQASKTGNYILLSGLATSFRNEPFPFSDYKNTMDDLLRIIPDQNKHTSRLAKCKTCRKTAEYTQRLINGEPAPYYDQLRRVDSEQSKATTDKKYSYEPRCKEHFYLPGKEEHQFITYIIKQNNGISFNDLVDITRTTAKISPEITRESITTICQEKQALRDRGNIYHTPTLAIATQMP